MLVDQHNNPTVEPLLPKSFGDHEDSYEQLSGLVNMLMGRHRTDWRTTEFHSRNIAVLFYAHTPADWGNGLFRLSAVRIGPTLREESVHQNLRDDMTNLYSSCGR